MAIKECVERKPVQSEEEGRQVADARGGVSRAAELRLAECESMVRALAAQFRIPGMETGDLRQIARLGVLEAIRDYDAGRGCTFARFAAACARRRLLSAAAWESQAKRRGLNGALPLPTDAPASWDAAPAAPAGPLPRALLRAKPHLTALEYAVAVGWCEERTYAEMARALRVSPKSVDNAWKRAKAKMRRLPIWEE